MTDRSRARQEGAAKRRSRTTKRARMLTAIAGLLMTALLAQSAGASVQVFHSPNDDGLPAAGGVPLLAPDATHVLHLYMDGGSTPSSQGACENGGGDEICAYRVEVIPDGQVTLDQFTGVPNSRRHIEPAYLSFGWGNAITGDLGPTKLGDLTVTAGPDGGVEILAGEVVRADLSADTVLQTDLIAIPEPAVSLALLAGVPLLAGLSARRRKA